MANEWKPYVPQVAWIWPDHSGHMIDTKCVIVLEMCMCGVSGRVLCSPQQLFHP